MSINWYSFYKKKTVKKRFCLSIALYKTKIDSALSYRESWLNMLKKVYYGNLEVFVWQPRGLLTWQCSGERMEK